MTSRFITNHTPVLALDDGVVKVCSTCSKPWPCEEACVICAETGLLKPPHDASPRCRSGGREHCTCDTCF